MTSEEREYLLQLSDNEIDCSDIPDLSDLQGWSSPGRQHDSRNRVLDPSPEHRLLLLDEKVVEYFRESGDDAPARMNSVLLDYVEAHRKSA